MKKKSIYLTNIILIVLLIIVCIYYKPIIKNIIKLEYEMANSYKIIIPSLILSIIVTIVGIYTVLIKRKPKQTKEEEKIKLKEINPLEMKFIYDGYFSDNQFYITFLNLVKKGSLIVTKENNKIYVSIQDESKPLEKYEIEALNIFRKWIKEDEDGQFKIERDKLLKIIKKDKTAEHLNKKYEEEIKNETYKKFGREDKLYKGLKKFVNVITIIVVIAISALIATTTKKVQYGTTTFFHLGVITILFTLLIKVTKHNDSATITFSILAVAYILIVAQYLTMINCQMLMLPFLLMFIILQYAVNLRGLSQKMADERENIRLYIEYLENISITKKIENDKINWENNLIIAESFGMKDKYLVEFDKAKDSKTNLAKSIKAVGNAYYEFKQEFEEVFKCIEE